jgi:hypothetical protein
VKRCNGGYVLVYNIEVGAAYAANRLSLYNPWKNQEKMIRDAPGQPISMDKSDNVAYR